MEKGDVNLGENIDSLTSSQKPYGTLASPNDSENESSFIDPAANAEVVKLADRRVLAFLCVLYLFNYLDRSNLSFAKTELSKDLQLTVPQYGLASSIFQIGYLIFEVPANMILKKSRASLWLGLLVILFGIMAVLTVLAGNYTELMWLRFALGVAESGFAPGALYYLTFWYKSEELASRNGIFLLASSISSALGGILAYGIFQLEGVWGLRGWQWLFIMEGFPAIILGIITMLYLPDHPSSARFFTVAQKEVAAKRVPRFAKQTTAEPYNWKLIINLVANPVFWCFAGLNVCTNVASYGIGAFLPAILEDMGFESMAATLRTTPVYLWQAVWIVFVTQLADRCHNHFYSEFSSISPRIFYLLHYSTLLLYIVFYFYVNCHMLCAASLFCVAIRFCMPYSPLCTFLAPSLPAAEDM
jgi:ACS family tartrate transporter-like MFS transporter